MPFLSAIIEAVQRVVAYFDRRRGLLIVLIAAFCLVAGTSVAVVTRPPVLAPALDAANGALLAVFALPARGWDRLTGAGAARRKIMELELETARLREAERENRRLREMLGYEPPPRNRTVPARVVGLDLDPVRGVAWISAGSRRGFLGGEPVVTVRGLVGVIDQVEPWTSRVRLLRNEDTPVSVRDTRSRVLGILEWDPGSSRLQVTKIPLQADVAPGDTLISSGLGGVFPPGLRVGVAETVSQSPERLLKEVGLRPFAAFHRLEEVFVLIPQVGPVPEPGPDERLPEGPPPPPEVGGR